MAKEKKRINSFSFQEKQKLVGQKESAILYFTCSLSNCETRFTPPSNHSEVCLVIHPLRVEKPMAGTTLTQGSREQCDLVRQEGKLEEHFWGTLELNHQRLSPIFRYIPPVLGSSMVLVGLTFV